MTTRSRRNRGNIRTNNSESASADAIANNLIRGDQLDIYDMIEMDTQKKIAYHFMIINDQRTIKKV